MELTKLVVTEVGVAKDVSFPAGGNQITCYLVQCKGLVDNKSSSFTVKIYGNGSDTRIKVGSEMLGKVGSYNSKTFYEVKKDKNPKLFEHKSNGNNSHEKKGGNELEAIKLANDLVRTCISTSMADHDYGSIDELADKAIDLARTKYLPYLNSITVRHDDISVMDDAKKLKGQAIRSIIKTNGLGAMLNEKKVTPSMLSGLFEESGSDVSKFVKLIRNKYDK